jgi:hypothetical protein
MRLVWRTEPCALRRRQRLLSTPPPCWLLAGSTRPPGNHLVRGMAALRSVYLKPGLVSTHQLMPPFALPSPLGHEHSIQSGQQFVT